MLVTVDSTYTFNAKSKNNNDSCSFTHIRLHACGVLAAQNWYTLLQLCTDKHYYFLSFYKNYHITTYTKL